MDGKVRGLRDQFVTYNWSELLYNGLYFSPEREFIENSLLFSQRRVVCERSPIRVNYGDCKYLKADG
jgi:argininosuccinate synthase